MWGNSRHVSNQCEGNEGSITQILSQRLGNMEQQLALLRGDLKDAVDELKRKDQEIITLQNKITLAERRRDINKLGGEVDEDLRDLSEDIDPETNSKRVQLEKECETLAQKLQEMEKFFGDYGLAWIKEDALDEKDPNNLWVRRTNIHYTPDFEKIFLVVEELNVGNAQPQIVKKRNSAQFKTADLINLTLYADGIQVENNPFRKYDSPSVEEFFKDLEDGYFPTELKGQYPEGVIFKVKDMRNTNFSDDPNKRPVKIGRQNPGITTTSTTRRGSASEKLRTTGKNVGDGSRRISQSEKGLPKPSSVSRKSRTDSRKGSASGRRSTMESQPDGGNFSIPPSTYAESTRTVDGKSSVPSRQSITESQPAGTPTLPSGTTGEESTRKAEIKESAVTKDQETTHIRLGDKSSPHSEPTENKEFKQLFQGDSPITSTQRVPNQAVKPHQLVDLVKEMTDESFGLPRPPLTPSLMEDSMREVPIPMGPPSTHFDNYFLNQNKNEETQTSRTNAKVEGPQLQPTHITNITYNEAPITIQVSPSELKLKRTIPETQQEVCSVHHPDPCDSKCKEKPTPVPDDGGIGHIGLIKIPGETEYREKFGEGAVNNVNVLQEKKKSHEQPQAKVTSPPPIVLTSPYEVPIPPDPLPFGDTSKFDPTVAWPNFTYFGHPKGQETSPPPPPPNLDAKKKSNDPQLVQLNKKTSDRMIAVRMRTQSGSTEYLAHLYPEESVKRLWSLLKMNGKDHTLTTENGGRPVTEDTFKKEILSEGSLRIIVSRRGMRKAKNQYFPARPDLGVLNPDLFKSYPGEVERKAPRNTRTKKDDSEFKEKTPSAESGSSESLETKKYGNARNSSDLFISQNENRDWLSKEAYHRKPAPRVTANDLQKMLDAIKEVERVTTKTNECSISTVVSDSHHVEGNKINAPPRIVIDETGSILSTDLPIKNISRSRGKKLTNAKTDRMNKNISLSRTALDRKPRALNSNNIRTKDQFRQVRRDSITLGTEITNRQTVIPSVPKSRSTSIVSESKCILGSYVAEPRKKNGERQITNSHVDPKYSTSHSSLVVPGLDPIKNKSSTPLDVRVDREVVPSDLKTKSDISIGTPPQISHSRAFKRSCSSRESILVEQKIRSDTGLVVDSNDAVPSPSKTNMSAHTSGSPNFGRTDSPKAGENNVDNVDIVSRGALKDRNELERQRTFLEEVGKREVHQVTSSGIGHDGFDAATLLEIVKAMLNAEMEYEKEKLKGKNSKGVLIRKLSSESSVISEKFVPPKEVLLELEELKQSFRESLEAGGLRRKSSRTDCFDAKDLLEEALSGPVSLEKVINQLNAEGRCSSGEKRFGVNKRSLQTIDEGSSPFFERHN